jgi:serine/threonine-protein kinase
VSDLDLLRAALPAYEFQDVLGRGAWGLVVAARHRRLDRPVAVKMLPLSYTQDNSVRRRFATEARVLASLDHPHVVRIHDYIEQDEVCALVMERLTGGTLAERIRLGRMNPRRASAIQLAALHGLEHAHQHGILHRDIKPENLIFTADGVLKITDFGIATVLGEQAERLTADGVAMGTPAYMAPEQIEDSLEVGEAADIWAAAAVYYEMLTGTVPYPSRGTLQATLLARIREDARPIDAAAPDLPREIGRTVMRALERDPAKRYATGAEFADALEAAGSKAWGEEWLSTTSTPVFRAPPRSPSGGAPTTSVVPLRGGRSTGGRLRGRSRRTRLALAASAAVLVAAAATIGTLVATGGGGSNHGTGGGAQWASWISPRKLIAGPAAPTGLPPVPPGWGSRLVMGVNLPQQRQLPLGAHFGPGIVAEITFGGDPIDGPSWDLKKGPHPAATAVRDLEKSGTAPYGNYYVLRIVGRGVDNDASEKDILAQLRDRRKMVAYWKDVTELVKEFGSLHQPIPLDIDFGTSSSIETLQSDARRVTAVVAASGQKDLAGLPNTFAGWAQAWIRLRDKYAPKVMLGLPLDAWGSGDYLVPFGKNYKDADIDNWASLFAQYYRTLGAHFDFVNYVVAYGEAGFLTKQNGADYFAHPADFARLVRWVRDVTTDIKARVLLESVPVGNTVMAPENNTRYHWQDVYAQWLFADPAHGYPNLRKLRDAGALGVVFGFANDGPNFTCPCDAANDSQTQGVPLGQTPTRRRADSSDDDGGYLRQQVSTYLAKGGISLS